MEDTEEDAGEVLITAAAAVAAAKVVCLHPAREEGPRKKRSKQA